MSKRFSSTGYIARETIKGLPEAGKKVGGAIGKFIGRAMKSPFSAIKSIRRRTKRKTPELSSEELQKRRKINDNLRRKIKKYKESHPGFKVPREFRDLE